MGLDRSVSKCISHGFKDGRRLTVALVVANFTTTIAGSRAAALRSTATAHTTAAGEVSGISRATRTATPSSAVVARSTPRARVTAAETSIRCEVFNSEAIAVSGSELPHLLGLISLLALLVSFSVLMASPVFRGEGAIAQLAGGAERLCILSHRIGM